MPFLNASEFLAEERAFFHKLGAMRTMDFVLYMSVEGADFSVCILLYSLVWDDFVSDRSDFYGVFLSRRTGNSADRNLRARW